MCLMQRIQRPGNANDTISVYSFVHRIIHLKNKNKNSKYTNPTRNNAPHQTQVHI